MPFSRWYPISQYHYDPALQPTKPMVNLQQQYNEQQYRKIPKGRYDTTYRREYLNFTQKYIKPPTNVSKDGKANLNQYTVLPPITPQRSYSNQEVYTAPDNRFAPSIDHLTTEAPSQVMAENYGMKNLSLNYDQPQSLLPESQQHQQAQQRSSRDDNSFLPREPVRLSDAEEQSLMSDVMRDLSNYSSEQLKGFYTELTTYDPNLTGFVHHMYVTLVAMRNKLPISDSLLRFLMCKFVSPSQEAGSINYEQLVKYLAKCLGQLSSSQQQQQQQQMNGGRGAANQSQNYFPSSPRMNGMNSSRFDPMDQYDPDEQAILRLLHENMKEWDKAHQIDTDSLRKQFYDLDYNKRYVLSQRQIEDVLYKSRIPIQRSLIYQMLEKYCKVSTGLYRWPAFIDFLEKTSLIKTPNRRPDNYGQGSTADDSQEVYQSESKYRTTQLETLRKKVTEEERLEEIEKQIFNLQHLKQETQQRIDSRLGDISEGESWFTRFMRLANAMYSHRVNAGIEFLLPKDEAKRLITAYNTVYDLKIADHVIDDGLNKCTRKGNVLIDDLLKVIAKVK